MSLTSLRNNTFTLINQIPQSANEPRKIAWIKHTLPDCGKIDGLYDKSNNQMYYKSNTWTAYINCWETYKPPHWINGGYYSLSKADKANAYTVGIGDLLIFADIPDDVPKTIAEFNALRDKYKDCGGVVTGCEVYVKYKPDGSPWKTNHIEVIKA